jgi:hypothetical protein
MIFFPPNNNLQETCCGCKASEAHPTSVLSH